MKISIDIKHLFFLTLAFILFTVIGTVTHELGHIIVAKSYGYETTLHYRSMNYKNSDLIERLTEIYNENKTLIENETDFDQKAEYEKGIKKYQSSSLYITIGGPLQTILTGIVGLLIISYRRDQISKGKLRLIDWLAVFLALFWLREVFNVAMSIGREVISPNGSYFTGDEKKISYGLNLWEGTIPLVLGILGLLISIFVIFRIIPHRLRLTFITGGFLGGILGFLLWMDVLGPELLP